MKLLRVRNIKVSEVYLKRICLTAQHVVAVCLHVKLCSEAQIIIKNAVKWSTSVTNFQMDSLYESVLHF